MDYYSSVKINEIMLHITTYNENIMPIERASNKIHLLYDSIYMKFQEKANP